ncbi:MAG: myo-inosose-2 dehydratase [Bacillota bacterium]|nr:myo-inosose-2 dehydratase [Bacillota bacterium]
MLDPLKIRLAIAPIGWTNDDLPDLGAENTFAQCVSEMALAGFAGCELGSRFPQDISVLHQALSLRNLQVCNAWFSTFFTSRPPEETYAAFTRQVLKLKALGAGIIGVSEQGNSIQGRQDRPILEHKPVFSEAEWESVCRGFDNCGQIARDHGLFLTVHHHMGTGIQSGSEIDRLMQETDPERVGLLYDTGHLAFSGENPLEVLRRHAGRIRHVHLKDIRGAVLARVLPEQMSFLGAVRAGVFTVPGDGSIDFAPIFHELESISYSGWLVVEAEQDPAKADPLLYAMKARSYIREAAGL